MSQKTPTIETVTMNPANVAVLPILRAMVGEDQKHAPAQSAADAIMALLIYFDLIGMNPEHIDSMVERGLEQAKICAKHIADTADKDGVIEI